MISEDLVMLNKITLPFEDTPYYETKMYKKIDNCLFNTNISYYNILFNKFNVSGIPIYPTLKFKLWIIFLLQKIGLKKKNKPIDIITILGLAFAWHFYNKKICLPFNSDVVFIKKNFFISLKIQGKKQYVIKISRTKAGFNKIIHEKNALILANQINHSIVKTPKVLNFKNDHNENYIIEEYIKGRNLKSIGKIALRELYSNVFNYMEKFYFKSEIKLKPFEEPYIDFKEKIYPVIEQKKHGKEVLKLFSKIYNPSKKMLFGKIHGDLSHNNILITDNKEIVIIDWDRSLDNYILLDLKSSIYNTQPIFEDIYNRFDSDMQNSIYSYDEQLFLITFYSLEKYIYYFLMEKQRNLNSDWERMKLNTIDKQINSLFAISNKIQ